MIQDSRLKTNTWTLFLDRDGVINTRIPGGYVRSWEAFEFVAGSKEAIVRFTKLFNRVIVITNQQGIGKGLMTKEDLHQIHDQMLREVEEAGGRIDGIYYCPDLKTKPDNCRKPAPVMALQAQNDFPDIDFQRSIMVGDSLSDLQFGARLGMKVVWVDTKEEDIQQIERDIEEGLKVDWRVGRLAELLESEFSGF